VSDRTVHEVYQQAARLARRHYGKLRGRAWKGSQCHIGFVRPDGCREAVVSGRDWWEVIANMQHKLKEAMVGPQQF
jgi:hypothetical protein